MDYLFTFVPRCRAMVARRAHNPKVAGSSPVSATNSDVAVTMFKMSILLRARFPSGFLNFFFQPKNIPKNF